MSATFAVREGADGITETAIYCEHGRRRGPSGDVPRDTHPMLSYSMNRGLNRDTGCSCKVAWIEEDWERAGDAAVAYGDGAVDFDEFTCSDCTLGFYIKAGMPGTKSDGPNGEAYFFHQPECPTGAATEMRRAWRPDVMDGSTRVV